MITREDMKRWLGENTTLSESSVYKYAHAAETISKDMYAKGVIPISLFEMSPIQIDVYMPVILSDPDFVKKNSTGNKMYSNALKQFRNFRIDVSEYPMTAEEIQSAIPNYDTMEDTERQAIVKSRIGQGRFKKLLLEKYHERCMITGITQKKLLIASHIKPWSVCDNRERLSVNNGFILSPTYDRLFDTGLISFENSGKIVLSHLLTLADKEKLSLAPSSVYDIQANTEPNYTLEYHRDVVFIK